MEQPHNRAAHEEFFLKRLGQLRYDLLFVRKNTPRKDDELGDRRWLSILLKENGWYPGKGQALSGPGIPVVQ